MKDNFEASVKSGVAPDPSWIRKNDEIVVNVIQKTRQKLLRTLFFLALTIAAVFFKPILAVVFGIITAGNLFMLAATGQRMPSSFLKEIYEEGMLAPGMIVKTQPLTVAVLANMAAEEEAESRYGCFFQEVRRLPGAEGKLFEKIPCSCMFRYKGGQYHTAFQPHPLFWATSDQSQIQDALLILEKDQQEDGTDLWGIIRKTAEEFPDIHNEYIVELDEAFRPVGLKHYQEDEFHPYISGAVRGNYVKPEQEAVHLAEDTPAAAEFNKLADLAAKHLVYDYVNRSCDDGDYPFHNNPGFFTYIGDGARFLQTEQKRKLDFAEGEVPLIGGNLPVTTKGCWKKKEFIPWEKVSFGTKLNSDGEIEVLINGDLSAVMPCHPEEYANRDVFGTDDIIAVRELERQRVQEFLEDVKSTWGGREI